MKEQRIINRRYYPELDGLRAIAILLVIWLHASIMSYVSCSDTLGYASMAFYKLSTLGGGGVCLFFVLSGFLITNILIDTNEDKNKIKKFFIRRSLRIFPLYYASLIVFAVLSYCCFGNNFEIQKVTFYIFYLQNFSNILFGRDVFLGHGWQFFSHLWSLAIEEHFYLIWPFFFFWIYNRYSSRSCLLIMLALIITSTGLRFMMSYWTEWQYPYIATFSRVDALIMGAMAAYIIKKHPDYFIKIQKRVNLITPVFPLFILFLGVVLIISEDAIITNVRYMVTAESLCSLFFLVLVLNIPKEKNILSRILCSDIFRKIARVSLWDVHISRANNDYLG